MTLFETNARSIIDRYPRFAAEILDTHEPAVLKIEEAQNGTPTIRDEYGYMHSRRDPVREAERTVALAARGDEPAACICFGFGLGYFVEAAMRRFPTAELFIVEPDVSFFLGVLAARNLEALLSSDRTNIVLGLTPEEAAAGLSAIPEGNITLLGAKSLYARNASFFDSVRERIERLLNRREINRNTLTRFGTRWIRNLSSNLPVLAGATGVSEIKNLFRGVPSLVLAAGPSLDDIVPQLPQLANRMLVIAVDTTLRAVLAAGVDPDIVVVVDPQYWNTRHLDRCVTKAILVSESSSHPRVFRTSFRRTLFCSSLFPLGIHLESKLGEFGRLGAGGSVATTAWDLARYVGSKPIYMAGLDLGYPDLQTHFRGSMFEERAHKISRRNFPAEHAGFMALHDANPYLVPSAAGGSVLTDKRLIVYKWWFESQLESDPNTDTQTLSGRGIAIDGIRSSSLEEVLALPQIREEIIDRLRQTKEQSRRLPLTRVVRELIHELTLLSTTTRDAVETCRSLIDRGRLTSRDLEILDDIDESIRGNMSKEIVGFLMQEALRDVPDTADPMQRSIDLYRQIGDSAEFHVGQLSRGIDLLDQENSVTGRQQW